MARPCKCRKVSAIPNVVYFKPRGIPLCSLQEACLSLDEVEAIHLADLDSLYHENAAKQMDISRQTFGNIVNSARRKFADALINGKAMQIKGGVVKTKISKGRKTGDSHEWRLLKLHRRSSTGRVSSLVWDNVVDPCVFLLAHFAPVSTPPDALRFLATWPHRLTAVSKAARLPKREQN